MTVNRAVTCQFHYRTDDLGSQGEGSINIVHVPQKERNLLVASRLGPQDETRPLAAQHLERRHALNAETDAGIRDLDLFR